MEENFQKTLIESYFKWFYDAKNVMIVDEFNYVQPKESISKINSTLSFEPNEEVEKFMEDWKKEIRKFNGNERSYYP